MRIQKAIYFLIQLHAIEHKDYSSINYNISIKSSPCIQFTHNGSLDVRAIQYKKRRKRSIHFSAIASVVITAVVFSESTDKIYYHN